MKNVISSIAFVFLLILSITSVSAAVTVQINSTQLINGQIYFTGDEDDWFDSSEVSVKGQGILPLTVRGSGSASLKFATTTLTHESDTDNKINITNIPFTTLPANASSPKTLDIVSINDVEAGIYTGTLQVLNSTNFLIGTVPIKVLVPAIEVTDISVKDTLSDISDTKLEKGQKFTITIDYKNIADQTDLENVVVKVGVYQGDKDGLDVFSTNDLLTDIDGDELEEEKDVGDMSNGKSSSETFEFEMPFDMSDGDEFTILAELTADSQDTSSKFYARSAKQKISASVPDNKVEITKFTAMPSSLICGVNRTKISVQIRNIGDTSEDVQLFLRNSATGTEKLLNNGEDVELDDQFDDEDSFTQAVEEIVLFNDLKSGQNTYTLTAYFNDGDSSVQEDVVITSQSCDTTISVPTSGNSDVVVIPPTTIIPTTSIPTGPTSPISNPSYVTLKDVSGFGFDSDLILPIAIGIGGLVIGIIVALLVIPRP